MYMEDAYPVYIVNLSVGCCSCILTQGMAADLDEAAYNDSDGLWSKLR